MVARLLNNALEPCLAVAGGLLLALADFVGLVSDSDFAIDELDEEALPEGQLRREWEGRG
jgi:hypothetical protein